jgi:hemolysin activation/secretion protein
MMVVWVSAYAQTLPNTVNITRNQVFPSDILPQDESPLTAQRQRQIELLQVPEGFDDITFLLQAVVIEGNITAYSIEELNAIYFPYIGGERVPVSILWEIANKITEKYQQDGYFLSRAFVPEQVIGEGLARIRVVEGFIGEISIDSDVGSPDNPVIEQLKQRLTDQKPIQFKTLESVLLRLNDLPGYDFQSTLKSLDNAQPGAVALALQATKEPSATRIFVNNHASRFTGPHRTGFATSFNLRPLHQSYLSVTSSLPKGEEVHSLAYTHDYQFHPDFGLSLSTAYTGSEPGYTLAPNELESRSLSLDFGLNWYAVKQRNKELTAGIEFSAQDIKTDILGTTFVRDNIRTLALKLDYRGFDFLKGYNIANAKITRGVKFLGSSEQGDPNLSRNNAKPDFTKLNLSWFRQMPVYKGFVLSTSFAAQKASGPLYSSEEFGFGGPNKGRAYDPSELLGDEGVTASIEAIYTGLKKFKNFKFNPYFFYDIGKIWNKDTGQENHASAATTGFGLRLFHDSGFKADLSIAQPLTRSISNPIYGQDDDSPRIYFQISYDF